MTHHKKDSDLQIIYLNNGIRHWGSQPSDYTARPETHVTVITQGITGLQIEDQCFLLQAPCAVIMPPYFQSRFIGPDTPVEMMVAVLLNIGEPWYSRLMPRPQLQIFPLRGEVIGTLQHLHEYCQSARAAGDEFSEASSSALLLSWLAILLRERSQASLEISLSLTSVPEAIAARLSENIQVGTLAREIGLSESTFRRQYRARFGNTPMSALREARLLHAANLLSKSDLKVQAVAHACGFATVQAFSKFFRQHMGISPAKWRRTDPELRWKLRDMDKKKTKLDNETRL
jgi:AraC-like DNA-binding protein